MTLGTILTVVGSFITLLLYLLQTKWSDQAKWWKEWQRLETEYATLRKDHATALGLGDSDRVNVVYAKWLQCAETKRSHRAIGLQKGYIRGA